MPNQILIIEDDINDYETLRKGLRSYEVYPRNIEEHSKFITELENWIDQLSDERVEKSERYFERYFQDKKFEVILLDIKLSSSPNDKSGLYFLEYIRNRFYTLTPIIMLSSLPPSSVKRGLTNAAGMANYYLHKGTKSQKLSNSFFKSQLIPVITMLITWKKMNPEEHIIQQVASKYYHEVTQKIDEHFKTVAESINFISCNIEELINYSKWNLSLLRYNIKLTDKKSTKIVDRFLNEIEMADKLHNIDKHKKPLLDSIKGSYDDIVKAIIGAGKKELSEILKDTIKDGLGLDENDPILKELFVIFCDVIRKNIKTVIFL